eukprot:3035081-Rhodomonas_salina.1
MCCRWLLWSKSQAALDRHTCEDRGVPVGFLAPLVQAGAITLSAHIPDCVIHFRGAHGPPVVMQVQGNLSWLIEHKQDPLHSTNINSLARLLGSSDTDWYEGFDLNEQAIRDIQDPAASGRQCTCNDGKRGCFIQVAMSQYSEERGEGSDSQGYFFESD